MRKAIPNFIDTKKILADAGLVTKPVDDVLPKNLIQNTAEVTTALAIAAEKIQKNKAFNELSDSSRRNWLITYGQSSCRFFNLTKDQRIEFSERYINMIFVPWLTPRN